MKKLSLLFALICVSVMGWAIDWSGYSWLGNGGVDNTYTEKFKATVTPNLGTGFINNLQMKGTNAAIHIAMPSAEFGTISLDAADYTLDGAGFFPHLSALTLQENTFTVVCGGTTYTFNVYNADGTTGGGGGQTPEPYDPTSVDWTSSDNTTTYHKFSAQFQIAAENAANMPTGPLNIQQPAWAAFEGLYVEFPAGVSACAFDDVTVTDGTEYDGNTGAGIVLNPSAFTNEITKVTVTHGNGTTTFYVHNANAGGGGGDPEPAESPYCDLEIGHEANPSADVNSFILLSVGADGKGHTIVNIKQDAGKNSKMFDLINVDGIKSIGTDVATGGSDEMAVVFNTPSANGDGNIVFTLQWSTVGWNGRWQCVVTVPANATCASADPFPGENTYCKYTDNNLRTNNANVILTWDTNNDGDVVITLADGEGATNTHFRNEGFEYGGGKTMDDSWFVYSGTNHATCELASTYFTVEQATNGGNTYALRLKSGETVPNGAVVAFLGHAFSWKNDQDGGAYTENKIFAYDYGYHCPFLAAPTNVAVNSTTNVITFDAVTNATTYTAYVYLDGILKHRQVVASGDVLNYTPFVTGTYQVEVTAAAAGYPTSDPSDAADWSLTASPVVVGNSLYCEYALPTFVADNVDYDANITWETGNDGSITITLSPNSEETAVFREQGMKLADFTVGAIKAPAAGYFNRTYAEGGSTVVLTLKDANIAPGQGETIYFDGYVECTVNGTNTWPTAQFAYIYGSKCSGQKHVTVAVNDADMGSATVNSSAAVDVDENTQVTLVAVPEEGFEFVNWTKGGVEVSTLATYTPTISTASDFVANFDYARTTYCHQEVLTSGGKKVYLTVGKGAAEGTYQVIIEGSSELTITGINNANTAINHVKYLSYDGNDVPMNVANEGWKFENTGYGVIKSAEIKPQTNYTWRDIYMWRPDLYIGTSAGEQNINSILDNQHYFNWDNDCADATAPEMAAPTAAVLNTTDVRLTLSATDNWEGIITYNINYKPTDAEGDGVTITPAPTAASGEQISIDVTGLTTNTEYTFTVTAKDAANNVCAAQSCTATPAGDIAAPTNVSITAVALTNTIVRLTLSADDDYVGDLTYNITYDNAGAASTSAAQGTSTTLDITGLTADTEYHFSVTATDAANNTSAAVNALAVRTYATNLALNRPCTAGHETDNAGEVKEKSNDGDKASRWSSYGSANKGTLDTEDWWAVQLDNVYAIDRIRLSWQDARSDNMNVYVSMDGENWTLVQNFDFMPASSANGEAYTNYELGGAQGRYIKVLSLHDYFNGAYGISFWELEAYGSLATDVTAPVISSFTADGASTTSVVLKATATDNFNGDLTYTFYCNDVALADPVVKTSGVEATYVVNELSMSTNYNFKVNVSDGVNNTMSDVVVGSPINDAQAPADVTVTSEATHNSITLTLRATDNLGGMIYYTATCGETVKNAQAVSGESVEVTFDGLDYSTPYAFSIVAKDGSNNEAEPVAHNKTTLRLPYPTSAAPAPAFAEASVRPVFSSAYNKDCNFYDWGGSGVAKQTYGAKKLNHEAAYFGIADFGTIKVDADDELYLSVWTNEDIQFRVVPIINNTQGEGNLPERGAYTQTLTGGQWNVVHFTMSEFNLDGNTPAQGYDNFDEVYQIKIDSAGNQTFWLDNIYFRRKGALSDEESNADFIAANANEGQDVVLNRTILANDGWYTLCVPFDMDADKVVEVFGNSTIAEMTGAEDRGTLIHLNFDYVNAIEAGHPYLIQPGISFTEGSIISGVTIKNVEPIVAGNDLMHFQGVYNATTLTDENIRFVADDNYLYSPAVGGTEMGAFRCYFTIPDGSSALAPGKRAKVVMGPQTATDIDGVQSSAISIQKVLRDGQLLIIREGRVYSAQGQILK